jgi:hypothetical protein
MTIERRALRQLSVKVQVTCLDEAWRDLQDVLEERDAEWWADQDSDGEEAWRGWRLTRIHGGHARQAPTGE